MRVIILVTEEEKFGKGKGHQITRHLKQVDGGIALSILHRGDKWGSIINYMPWPLYRLKTELASIVL
jgi:hypothetical protein